MRKTGLNSLWTNGKLCGTSPRRFEIDGLRGIETGIDLRNGMVDATTTMVPIARDTPVQAERSLETCRYK